LTSSLLLTLVLVPVVYYQFDILRDKIPALFRKPLDVFRRRKKSVASEIGPVLVPVLEPANGEGLTEARRTNGS